MTQFAISITYADPYPKTTEYREEASNFAVAVSRGIKTWRQERGKGKKIKELQIKVIKL